MTQERIKEMKRAGDKCSVLEFSVTGKCRADLRVFHFPVTQAREKDSVFLHPRERYAFSITLRRGIGILA
jgi:hypothetical protein